MCVRLLPFIMTMKKILSIILVFIIMISIIFQTSVNAHAVIGIDDAILIGGICFDLAAMGITIYEVGEFVKTDTFNDFCMSIGNDIDEHIDVVKYNGKLFYGIARSGWDRMVNWVKSKFSGKNGRTGYEFDTIGPPRVITLSNGINLPWAEFMDYPFFIYTRPNGNYYAYCCTGAEAGAFYLKETIQICCVGTGKVKLYSFLNGASEWAESGDYNMTGGVTYKGAYGSVYNLRFASGSHMDDLSFYLYRTLPKIVNMEGDIDNSVPAQPKPTGTQKTNIEIHVDSDRLPGAVAGPVERITETQKIIIQVPQELVDDTDSDNPTLKTDIDVIAQYLSTVTTSDVKPRVLTQPLDLPSVKDDVQPDIKEVVDDIVIDTDVPVIEDQLNPSNDLDTANKFRLPKSFLEGFPFSIPYSVFIGIRSLIATPEAPYFSLPFSIPRLGIKEDVVIDLNNWTPLARLSRAFLSVIWVAALAMTASKFIKH